MVSPISPSFIRLFTPSVRDGTAASSFACEFSHVPACWHRLPPELSLVRDLLRLMGLHRAVPLADTLSLARAEACTEWFPHRCCLLMGCGFPLPLNLLYREQRGGLPATCWVLYELGYTVFLFITRYALFPLCFISSFRSGGGGLEGICSISASKSQCLDLHTTSEFCYYKG